MADAAQAVATVRHALHEQAVAENDSVIPAPVAQELQQMKLALAATAQAAFACAPETASPEDLQETLATALHANLSTAASTVVETRGKKDLGAYGSDLAVEVFPLFSSPKYVEVDFRYGVECGDDNLLLVFAAGSSIGGTTGEAAWHPVLRWDAPQYRDVRDAFGDFVLLTPLSGFPGQRNWRFVVAHGQPGCGRAGSPSRFDLDVLEPTADPDKPEVVWHFERPYGRNQVPRLSTTEDTLTLELSAPPETGKPPQKPLPTAIYRYQVGKDNSIEELPAEPAAAAGPAPSATLKPGTNSPQ